MPADLVIGARKSGVPRPWRAGAIALGMLGVALIVAWFIYRRSVTYDLPAGEITGQITVSTGGATPTLTYGQSSLAWSGAFAMFLLVYGPMLVGPRVTVRGAAPTAAPERLAV